MDRNEQSETDSNMVSNKLTDKFSTIKSGKISKKNKKEYIRNKRKNENEDENKKTS